MARQPLTFKQRAFTRALKGARAAGVAITEARIKPDGEIVLSFERDGDEGGDRRNGNPWDKALGVCHNGRTAPDAQTPEAALDTDHLAGGDDARH